MRLLPKKTEAAIFKALRTSLAVAQSNAEIARSYQEVVASWQELHRRDAVQIEEPARPCE